MNWIKRMFEDAQGIPDEARVMAVLMVLGFIGSSIYSVYTGHEFKAGDWGMGAGALAAGIGGWFKLRGES